MAKTYTADEIEKEFDISMSAIEYEIAEQYRASNASDIPAVAQAKWFKDIKDHAGTARNGIINILDKQRKNIKKLICDDIGYCKNIDNEKTKIATTIADALISGHLSIPIPVPIARLSVYIVRTRILDPFCECASH